MAVFRVVALCSLHMDAAGTFETLVNFYQTTWCNNPEDSHLHTHCRENLKSHNQEGDCDQDENRLVKMSYR
jgi:hypothetical protein